MVLVASSTCCAGYSSAGLVIISDFDYSSRASLGAGADVGPPETGCFKGTIDGLPSVFNTKCLTGRGAINHDNYRRTYIRARNPEGKAVVTLFDKSGRRNVRASYYRSNS